MADSATVGMVIVSHSPLVAQGARDMVRQMVGDEIAVAACGGDPDGGLGTSVPDILAAIDAVWGERGIVVLVDLGGAESNSEMAIELQPPERRDRIAILDAPIVEGAVMAATEAAGGGDLAALRALAREMRG